MFHCEGCLPVLVEEVIIERAHFLQLVILEEVRDFQDGAGLLVVGCRHGVVEASIVIGAEHLGACHLVCQAECSAVGYAWCSHLSFLRGDEDDTVGGTCAIDGGCGILQDGD